MTSIKAVALDVDGVLTDGDFLWGPDGQEWKRFSFRDVMGVSEARRAGLVIALISGEDTPILDRYASKMGIEDIYRGCKDKANAVREFAGKRGLLLSEIAFMGDDINDIDAMKLVGLSAAPANAHASVLAIAKFISGNAGGHGAVRELMDFVIQ
ncbi:MAG: HAD hydrolase family protein [Proteobacteria bacterium]|nr:HAD hydrolase family protein [Pseudomonadota bacterium]